MQQEQPEAQPSEAQPSETQSSKAKKAKRAYPLRTLRHRLLGELCLLRLPPLLIDVQNEIYMMSDPPQADIILIRRRGKAWTKKQRAALPDGIRDSKARYHLLECKFTESVNKAAVQQALSYDSLYLRAEKLKPDALQTYLLSAKTPDADFLASLGYHCPGVPGVYVTTVPILERVVLLVLNELSNEPHNELLRLFASRQAIRQQTMEAVMSRHLSEWTDEEWAIIFGLQRLYELEGQSMTQELTVDAVIEIGHKLRKQIIATLSPKDLDERMRKQIIATLSVKDLDERVRKQGIASASPDDRVAGLAPQERVAGLAPQERVAGLAPQERVAGLAPQERVAGLAPQERLAGLAPQERLVGLSKEEMAALLQEIEGMLGKQHPKSQTQRKRKRGQK